MPATALEIVSEQRCFGGVQGVYQRDSEACASPMRFSVYQPPQAAQARVPVLFFLAGLTCNEETFMIKAGAQRVAAELGLMLVACDTSPRHTGITGATADWEFGEGAGFYLDATQAPYSSRFNMYSHVVHELPQWIADDFPADLSRAGICGHSMGGHGALVIALRNPHVFHSVSAFAPIVAPSRVPWGQKALSRYLGEPSAAWSAHDACELVAAGHGFPGRILIDQGEADPYRQTQLRPELFTAACAGAGQSLALRLQPGYDHGYWFVQSFIESHLRHHAHVLCAAG